MKVLVFGKLGQVASELEICSDKDDDEIIFLDRKET